MDVTKDMGDKLIPASTVYAVISSVVKSMLDVSRSLRDGLFRRPTLFHLSHLRHFPKTILVSAAKPTAPRATRGSIRRNDLEISAKLTRGAMRQGDEVKAAEKVHWSRYCPVLNSSCIRRFTVTWVSEKPLTKSILAKFCTPCPLSAVAAMLMSQKVDRHLRDRLVCEDSEND